MVPQDSLKDLLCKDGLTRVDRLLVVLAVNGSATRTISEIQKLAVDAGLREAEKWNLSQILRSAKKYALRVKAGWTLSSDGKKYVGDLLAKHGFKAKHAKFVSDLRVHLGGLTDNQTKAFVEEAIVCFEHEQWRAAVVFSWVGAVSVLQEHVIKNALSQFNSEATRRDSKWKSAKTKDDLSRMGESDFLDILDKLSILGKNVKAELKVCLDRRNGCGHPNSFRVGENMVAAHIEALILNVFSQF